MSDNPTIDPIQIGRSLLYLLVREFLPDYLHLIEPDTAVHLLPEQATFPLVDMSDWTDEERSEIGTVIQVPARDGTTVTLLIQLETEPRGPQETARRFGRWFLALETRLVEPVLLSVIYLRGGRPGPNLESAALTTFFNQEFVRIFYTAFGLAHARADYYVERPEPLAWAMAAAMRPVHLSRQDLAAKALTRIKQATLSPERRELLSAFVHATLNFPST